MSVERCTECRHSIDDISTQVRCAECENPVHAMCAVRCGARPLTGLRDPDGDFVRVYCNVHFCSHHAMRRPTCRYPAEGGADSFTESDALRHGAGAPLCDDHVLACEFCCMALCPHHNSDDYLRREPKIYECRNCEAVCCSAHYEMCEQCDGQVECKPCAGLRLEDDWHDVYRYDYSCKHHRFMEHIEACVSPPDSPDGEPMTMETRRRLARNENDQRINN